MSIWYNFIGKKGIKYEYSNISMVQILAYALSYVLGSAACSVICDTKDSTEIRYISWTFMTSAVLEVHLWLKGYRLELDRLRLVNIHTSLRRVMEPEAVELLAHNNFDKGSNTAPPPVANTNFAISMLVKRYGQDTTFSILSS